MGSTPPFDIGTLIECTTGVYGGQPCLAGTRFPILQLAAEYNGGMSAEEIAATYEGIDLVRVFAGLAYYLANRAQIDAELDRRHRRNMAALAEREARRSERASA